MKEIPGIPRSIIRPNLLMGQRFLVSDAVRRRIIAAAGLTGNETVLEIGPGRGALTVALARHAGRVIAVEKDRRLAEALGERLRRAGIANVTLVTGDVLKIPMSDLNLPASYRVVANIPYYLTSRLIRRLLESEHPPQQMLLMVQQEVAERIVARPPKLNLLALAVQVYAEPAIIARVPRAAFAPQPNVDSALIRIADVSHAFFRRHRIEPGALFGLARAAFGQKRKTLGNSLAKFCGGKSAALALLNTSGLAPNARPQELSPDDWARLARALAAT